MQHENTRNHACLDLPQPAIDTVLAERLPFVVKVRHDAAGVRVQGISEWVTMESSEGAVTLQPLITDGRLTGQRPAHGLALADAFWEVKN